MQALFSRSDDGSDVVASATWSGGRVSIDASDPEVKRSLERIFRATPVVVDDPARRPLGAKGESVVHPGSVEWFRVAAFKRSGPEGLSVRLVPGVAGQGGWDPAAAYRTFDDTMRLLLERDHDVQ